MNNETNLQRPRFLEGTRLFLTPLSIEDLDKNLIWDNDQEMSFLDGGSHRPKTREVARDEFDRKLKRPGSMLFVIITKEDGTLIGNAELYGVRECHRYCNWRIRLDEKFQRQGYGTEAAQLLIRYVFEDLGFNRIKSDTHAGNVASQKFQESLGFVKEGVLRKEKYVRGEYLDDICYGMTRKDYERSCGNG